MASLNPAVRIFDDLDALSHAAADAFVQASAVSVGQRGRFLVALSGGNTPVPLYRLLGTPPYVGQVNWLATHAFWGDERCVPVEDLENSYRQVHDILLGRVSIPPTNVHRIQSELEPEDAAADYRRTLKEFASPPLDWPRFDMVLLGMGSDGHTASLFPGSELAPAAAALAITGSYENRPARRVTLSPSVFNSAREVIFLVSGEGKAQVLKRVLYGEFSRRSCLRNASVHWMDHSSGWWIGRPPANFRRLTKEHTWN